MSTTQTIAHRKCAIRVLATTPSAPGPDGQLNHSLRLGPTRDWVLVGNIYALPILLLPSSRPEASHPDGGWGTAPGLSLSVETHILGALKMDPTSWPRFLCHHVISHAFWTKTWPRNYTPSRMGPRRRPQGAYCYGSPTLTSTYPQGCLPGLPFPSSAPHTSPKPLVEYSLAPPLDDELVAKSGSNPPSGRAASKTPAAAVPGSSKATGYLSVRLLPGLITCERSVPRNIHSSSPVAPTRIGGRGGGMYVWAGHGTCSVADPTRTTTPAAPPDVPPIHPSTRDMRRRWPLLPSIVRPSFSSSFSSSSRVRTPRGNVSCMS